ncbi:MAG TPA: glycosyltransferase family 39 protein [Anaerolineales bacterium]
MKNKTQRILCTLLVALPAMASLVIAFLPYGSLKHLADSLMRDGNFKTLKENNAYIFRILMGIAGAILIWAAYGFASWRILEVRTWLERYWADLIRFMKGLRSTRVRAIPMLALLVIMALAVVFRLAHISDGMLHDESYTYTVFSSTSIFNIITNYSLPNNHILNSLLIFFSTRIFGIQPWVIRLPALLAGLLVVPTTYGLAKAIYDRATALAASLLIAVLPGAILYSTFGRGYSLVSLFTILSLWLAIYVRGNKNWFAWSLLVLFSALGFYTVPVMLFPFGVVFAWLFFENLVAGPVGYASKIDFLKYWLVAGISTAALVLILYTPVFIYTGPAKVFANSSIQPKDWQGYFSSIPHYIIGTWQAWTAGWSPIWAVVLCLGFILGLIFHRRLSQLHFPIQVAAFVWIAVLVLYQRPASEPKIWVFLQAPFLIWCAAGITGLLQDIRFKFIHNLPANAVVLGIAILPFLINAIHILPTIPQRWADKGPEEEAVLYIKNQIEPQDLIIIDTPYDAAVWYYSLLYGVGGDSRFDKRRPFNHLFVIVSPNEGQSLKSVIDDRGPDSALVNEEAAHFLVNINHLDIYLVPHR